MNCYAEFAKYYDDLIKEDIPYEKWALAVRKICSDYNVKQDRYLDAACGTGNLTEEISKNFNECFAVDMSSEMLAQASSKYQGRIKFVCQDMRNLNLNRKFNLITCALDGTNYLLNENDIESFFTSVGRHLEDDGIFVFDINTYYKLTHIVGNNIFTYDGKKVYYTWENELEDNIVSMYLTFFIKNGDMYSRFDEFHQERAYKEDEIENYIKKSGLRVIKKLNCYEDKKITENTERITYVVKKS